jgi:hypothetical protein
MDTDAALTNSTPAPNVAVIIPVTASRLLFPRQSCSTRRGEVGDVRSQYDRRQRWFPLPLGPQRLLQHRRAVHLRSRREVEDLKHDVSTHNLSEHPMQVRGRDVRKDERGLYYRSSFVESERNAREEQYRSDCHPQESRTQSIRYRIIRLILDFISSHPQKLRIRLTSHKK